MIWLITGAIVCVSLIIGVFCDSFNDWFDKIGLSIAAIFFSVSMTLIVLLVSSLIVSNCAETKYNMISDTKIIALKDNQNMNGNFYIFGGYVDEDLYYYYATETEFGYKTEKIEAENTYIRYTNKEPHIERYCAEFVNNRAHLLGFCMLDDKYIIYCPEGTVTNEFKVDLE